jgi:hypothetical protein
MTRKIEVAAAVQTESHQNGFVALAAKVFERKVLAEPHVQPEFRAKVKDFANLRLQHVTRQAVFWNAEVHHAAGHRGSVKNGYGITKQRQIVRGGHACRSGTDDGNFFRASDAWPLGKNVYGVP